MIHLTEFILNLLVLQLDIITEILLKVALISITTNQQLDIDQQGKLFKSARNESQ